jgi:murein L,D-transpeptidase YafK
MSFRPDFSLIARFGAVALAGAGLSACNDAHNTSNARAWRPIPSETVALMNAKGSDSHQPIVIRAYKKEAELEVWKMKKDGQYVHLKTFPMCRWSGQLGPKVREGDRQVPEGFYAITPGQMNPNSNYYLSFNVGYPNALDRALGHSGGMIMVHGACSSAGCFSMTDNQIAEIYAIAREAFGGGQRAIQMQSFPFRMTAENLAKHRLDPNMPFWRQLKKGSDHFEVTKREPSVGACGRRYVFDAQPANGGSLDASGACPTLTEDAEVKNLVADKESADNARIAELVAKGTKPVRIMYADGGQHPDFAHVDEVSRPEALAKGPVEVALDDKGKPKKDAPVAVAAKASAPARTETVAARSDEPQTTGTTAFASAGAVTGDSIGRWLGLNKADTTPAPAKSGPPETILVTDPDKAQKTAKPKAASPVKPQASLAWPTPQQN